MEGLENIASNTIRKVIIELNPNLSICNIQNVCEFLENNQSYQFHSINNNASGCATAVEVANSCGFILGTEENIAEVITLYPNPTQNTLNLSGVSEAEIVIYDLTGKEVFKIDYKNKSIDISKISTGIYFVTIESNNRKTTKKLIKL